MTGLQEQVVDSAVLEAPMAYTYEELKGKTIAELREIAKGVEQHEAVQGFSQMNKEHLLPALCKALGVDTHGHHHVAGPGMVTTATPAARRPSGSRSSSPCSPRMKVRGMVIDRSIRRMVGLVPVTRPTALR